jgi:hypothetical protein
LFSANISGKALGTLFRKGIKQIELSARYEQIENIKKELKNKILELTDIVIS